MFQVGCFLELLFCQGIHGSFLYNNLCLFWKSLLSKVFLSFFGLGLF